nr:guanosine nucleotide diphosphate dissociation inhibitor 2 [Tanacetum cinerariifolium]
MLNKPECNVVFDEEGKVCGVTSEGETAKCKKVVCDPSYVSNKPLHVGFTSDRGGNAIYVHWFTRKAVRHHDGSTLV